LNCGQNLFFAIFYLWGAGAWVNKKWYDQVKLIKFLISGKILRMGGGGGLTNYLVTPNAS
jgi:hypothetical protein